MGSFLNTVFSLPKRAVDWWVGNFKSFGIIGKALFGLGSLLLLCSCCFFSLMIVPSPPGSDTVAESPTAEVPEEEIAQAVATPIDEDETAIPPTATEPVLPSDTPAPTAIDLPTDTPQPTAEATATIVEPTTTIPPTQTATTLPTATVIPSDTPEPTATETVVLTATAPSTPSATSSPTISWYDGEFERGMTFVGYITNIINYDTDSKELLVSYSSIFYDGDVCGFPYEGSHMGVLNQIKSHVDNGYPEVTRAILQETDEQEVLLSEMVWTAVDDSTIHFGPEGLFEECRTP